jgi:hypothetical protein
VIGSRFNDKFQFGRSSFSSRSAYPPLPARTPASPKVSAPGAAPTSPTSPARRVVTDFAAFGAAPSASVFGTAVQSSPFSLAGGTAAFGAPRARAAPADEDEDEDEDEGPIRLREGAVTLDQVCAAGRGWARALTACVSGETYRDAERVEEHATRVSVHSDRTARTVCARVPRHHLYSMTTHAYPQQRTLEVKQADRSLYL